MKIRIIATWPEGQDEPWILEAWDEWVFGENPAGFQEALKNRKRDYAGDGPVRVGTLEVPDDSLRKMFEPVEEPPFKKGQRVRVKAAANTKYLGATGVVEDVEEGCGGARNSWRIYVSLDMNAGARILPVTFNACLLEAVEGSGSRKEGSPKQ